MSEYHKIETLYERDEKTFKVKPGVFKNPTYSLLKNWLWTEKIDGTNIRVIWRPGWKDGSLIIQGRTDEAQLPDDLTTAIKALVNVEKFREVFPKSEVIIYGEGYGAGIQKGGGDYRKDKSLIVFDVFIVDLLPENTKMGGWWLSHANVADVADKLNLSVVPFVGIMTLEDATACVRDGIHSFCAINPDKMAEGLVGRPAETLFDKKGHRIITKLKTRDFAKE